MKKVVQITSKLKYVGLLGIFGFLNNNPNIKLLWLFWLLGFIEIFCNFRIIYQGVLQLFGIPFIHIAHFSKLPNKENYRCKAKYQLPFDDEWLVANGSFEKELSHSWSIPTQRYAYDFLIIDDDGNTSKGDKTVLESYFCYGKNILAPADGVVIEIGSKFSDSKTFGDGTFDESVKDIRGNYIVTKHAHGEFSFIGHIRPQSIMVEEGQRVKSGDIIARCGNSGNTTEPHIHFHLQDGVSMFLSAGLPIEFVNISAKKLSNDSLNQESLSYANIHYIQKGQIVSNL